MQTIQNYFNVYCSFTTVANNLAQTVSQISSYFSYPSNLASLSQSLERS